MMRRHRFTTRRIDDRPELRQLQQMADETKRWRATAPALAPYHAQSCDIAMQPDAPLDPALLRTAEICGDPPPHRSALAQRQR